MDYFKEAKSIWQNYVPKSGQADTVQGELLRAVEKLRDEAMRNGNGNWDAGFETLIAFLKEKLFDVDAFSEQVILETKTILYRLEGFDDPCLSDEPYDQLGDRVVDYYKFYGSTPHIKNSDLKR